MLEVTGQAMARSMVTNERFRITCYPFVTRTRFHHRMMAILEITLVLSSSPQNAIKVIMLHNNVLSVITETLTIKPDEVFCYTMTI